MIALKLKAPNKNNKLSRSNLYFIRHRVCVSLSANTEKAEAGFYNNNGTFKDQTSGFNKGLFPDSVNLNTAQWAGNCYNH